MALKILATGDLHIGKKSSGVPDNIEESAAKFTWNRLVNLAIRVKTDVLVLTGDIVDQDNRYFEAIGPLQTGFDKLKKADITVFMIAGNHDYNVLPQIAGSGKYENVHLLGMNGQWEIQKFSKNGETIQFAGWSFPGQHYIEDPLFRFDKADIDINTTTIGLLHGDVDIAESKYAPVRFDSFLNKEVDVWVLGHIHKPQVLRDQAPHVCYPGSPHALSSKEQGPHGPVLFTIGEKRNDINSERIPLSPVRYESIIIDITNISDENSFRNLITSKLLNYSNGKIRELQDVSFLVFDVLLTGQHKSVNDIERWISPVIEDYDQELETETRISVRKVVVNVRPEVENIEELAKESSPAGVIAQSVIALQKGETTDFLEEVFKKWYSEHESMNNSGTYHPLQKEERLNGDTRQKARQYILNECNRLLSELIAQQAQ